MRELNSLEKYSASPAFNPDLDAPTGLKVYGNRECVKLQWEYYFDADLQSFRVYRGTEYPPTELVFETLGGTYFIDNTVILGQLYFYAVAAFVRDKGESAQSITVVVMPMPGQEETMDYSYKGPIPQYPIDDKTLEGLSEDEILSHDKLALKQWTDRFRSVVEQIAQDQFPDLRNYLAEKERGSRENPVDGSTLEGLSEDQLYELTQERLKDHAASGSGAKSDWQKEFDEYCKSHPGTYVESPEDAALAKKIAEERFVEYWDAMAEQVHARAVEKGWWENDRNDGEIIALIHSELSETLEALRKDNPPSEKIPDFTQVEEELADTVIRILDYAAVRKLMVGEAIVAKHTYNTSRPYKHGKKF